MFFIKHFIALQVDTSYKLAPALPVLNDINCKIKYIFAQHEPLAWRSQSLRVATKETFRQENDSMKQGI